MSEEIVTKAAEAGVTASGGVGGVTDPATGILGNTPGASYGVTNLPTSVNPTGVLGGILAPEQSRQFIDYMWDATTMAKDGRRVTMRGNTQELEKMHVGERIIRAANQADGAYENAGAKFTKIELTTKKIRLDWEISTESLEDNLEGSALEDHIVRDMTTQFGNDLEDLAINGIGSGANTFLNIMPGFIKLAADSGDAHEAVVTVANGQWTPEVMQKVIDALPRRYRAIKSGLKFYVSSGTFGQIVRNQGTNADAIYTDQYRNQYLSGSDQLIGSFRQTRSLGLPVMEVPYYPEGYVELTFPQNRIWGFQRDVTVNREYKPKKDTIEYTVYVRFGIVWEELDALAFADAAVDA